MVDRVDGASEIAGMTSSHGVSPGRFDDALDASAEALTRLAAIVESADDAIVTKTLKGVVTSWNLGAERIFGYTAAEMIGRHITTIIPAVRVDEEAEFLRRLAGGERIDHYETIRRHKDGHAIDISVTLSPLRDERGAIIGISKIARNIAEQKRAIALVRAQSEMWRVTLSSIGDGVIATNAKGRITFMNAVAESLTGWNAADGRSQPLRTVFRIVNEHTRLPAEDPVTRVLRDGVTVGLANHTILVARGGQERPIDDSAAPIHDENGQVIGVVLVFRDGTQRRRAEAALAAEATVLSRLNELSSRLWRMTSLRAGLEEMLGATIELLGADKGNVQILDSERGVLVIAAHRGFEQDFLDAFREVSTEDDAACGRALRAGQRIVIEDVEADALFAPLRPIARAAGYRAVQSTPLIGRDGAPLGMLSTHWRSVHQPGEQELRALDLYIRMAADFIKRCRIDEALREADRRKDEFLATLAHELRNPLAPIRNAVHILHLEGSLSSELKLARDVIDRQTRQMSRLLDDLMDVSRIVRNRIDLRKERVDLGRVLQEAVEISRPLIDGRGHAFSLVQPPEPVHVEADATRLAQVFSNLLNNAATYSEPKGRIVLAVERHGDEVVVFVRDHGMGIPKEMLSRIFDLFTQVERSFERGHAGLGIGLTLVKRLVELHGGRITAHSDGAGTGAEFMVRLPVSSAPEIPRSHGTDDTGIADASTRRRVLVVDDNSDAATSLSLMLGMMGHETRTAFDGFDGLEVAAEFRPDVIFLDIGMAKMNGYEMARRLRQEPWGKHMVLIAVTGWGQAEDKRRSAEAGFDHHVVKPADPLALAKLLGSLARTS